MHHDDKGAKERNSSKAVDPAVSARRGWIHKRQVELYLERNGIHPDGLVDNKKWQPCYRQAEEEWEKKNATSRDESPGANSGGRASTGDAVGASGCPVD